MTLEQIRQEAEAFREENSPHLDAKKIPLDLITFTDLRLKLDLIPYPDLYKRFSAEAALLSDFSGFFVDGVTFDKIETAPEWQLNRLRFSLAHEIGHWRLHRDLFAQAQVENFDSLLEWLNSHEGKKDQIEQEANEFAGRLLVPIEPLTESFDALAKALDALHGPHGWSANEKLRISTCELLGQKFGLHPQGISTRLHREGLWPSIY